jgi:hypothetical protein
VAVRLSGEVRNKDTACRGDAKCFNNANYDYAQNSGLDCGTRTRDLKIAQSNSQGFRVIAACAAAPLN